MWQISVSIRKKTLPYQKPEIKELAMKKTAVLFILVFAVLVTGCTTRKIYEKKYMGKWFHKAYLRRIEASGKHHFRHDMFDVEYDYKTNLPERTLTLKGRLTYVKSIEDSKFKHETVLLRHENLVLVCIFTDGNGTVNGVETANLPVGKTIVEPVLFEVTVPFKPEYKYVLTAYNARMVGT